VKKSAPETGCASWRPSSATGLLRVGDREGRLLPAHAASGGLVLLAALPPRRLAEVYRDPDAADVDLPAPARTLGRVRRQGFGLNNQATERGVTAIGLAVRGRDGEAVAALSLFASTAPRSPRGSPHLAPPRRRWSET
jgi:DNA-binding IclR family transcriptional regulator